MKKVEDLGRKMRGEEPEESKAKKTRKERQKEKATGKAT